MIKSIETIYKDYKTDQNKTLMTITLPNSTTEEKIKEMAKKIVNSYVKASDPSHKSLPSHFNVEIISKNTKQKTYKAIVTPILTEVIIKSCLGIAEIFHLPSYIIIKKLKKLANEAFNFKSANLKLTGKSSIILDKKFDDKTIESIFDKRTHTIACEIQPIESL